MFKLSQYAGVAIRCEFDVFIDTCLPFFYRWENAVPQILASLRSKKKLDDNGWPLLYGRSAVWIEDFFPLKDISSTIIDEVNKEKERTNIALPSPGLSAHFRVILCYPNHEIVPLNLKETRRSARIANKREKPLRTLDGYDLEGIHGLFDTCCVGELRKGNTLYDVRDTQYNIFYCATAIFNGDPCRRHLTAFSLVKHSLRLWHFDRAGIAVSSSININENPDMLVRLLLTLMYASKSELGIDTTMTRRIYQDHNKVLEESTCYRVTVGGHVYETIGSAIFGYSDNDILSRATRVWKAKRVEPDGSLSEHVYVLKDAWMQEDAVLEFEIRRQIQDNLGDDWEKAKRYFLTIVAEEVVEIDGEKDVTSFAQESTAFELTDVFYSWSGKAAARSVPSSQKRTASYRKHVRTVFEEYGTSVEELDDFRSFAKCMADVTEGLKWLHRAGIIHRDISTGNCLFYEGRGIIADCEYSRVYRSSTPPTPMVGTPDFTAVEYQEGRLFFIPSSSKTEDHDPVLYKPRSWFSYHFFHDLESVYWIYLWFIHFRVPSSIYHSSMQPPTSCETYFEHSSDGGTRRDLIITDKFARERIESSFEFYDLPNNPSLAPLLAPIGLCQDIREAYIKLQENVPEHIIEGEDDFWRFSSELFTAELYDKIIASFQLIAVESSDLRVEKLDERY